MKMKDHVLDPHKIIAERAERQKRELELNGLPTESEDASLLTPLSDSMYETSFSNSQPINEKQVMTFVVTNIFDPKQVFHLFNEDQVNFSWFKKETSQKDVPKMSPDKLKGFLLSDFMAKCCRHSPKLACRYLFFLMSVTTNRDVMDVCLKILEEQISEINEPFCIEVPDLLIILINYGTEKKHLWPENVKISSPSHLKFSSTNFSHSENKPDIPFPRSNLEKVLEILRFNLSTYPSFSEAEKCGMFHVMLNLLMANFVAGDSFLVLRIKEVLSSILDSYTDDEWIELGYKKVEDLVLTSCHIDLDPVGITQRVSSIPTTTLRGIQLQQCAAYYEVQNFLNFEEVILCGRVLFDDVYAVVDFLTRMNHRTTDFRRLYCTVSLITLSLDLNHSTENLDKIEALVKAMNQARHNIREMSTDMDTTRCDVKNLMCEIAVFWKDSVPNSNVV